MAVLFFSPLITRLPLPQNHNSSSATPPPFAVATLRRTDLLGQQLVIPHQLVSPRPRSTSTLVRSVPQMTSLRIGKAMRWWEKGLQPNMREITSAQSLVDSLLTAGDKLVIVDFFSPGCGGCKALHPKICQLAEQIPDVVFLQVNYEEHKSMCYSLNVHVLPFFRFYRGAQGRVCSFSCTNATIKKFKDALAKHGTDRCSLGPARGLEESELLALASNKDLSLSYTPAPPVVPLQPLEERDAEKAPPASPKLPLPSIQMPTRAINKKALVATGT